MACRAGRYVLSLWSATIGARGQGVALPSRAPHPACFWRRGFSFIDGRTPQSATIGLHKMCSRPENALLRGLSVSFGSSLPVKTMRFLRLIIPGFVLVAIYENLILIGASPIQSTVEYPSGSAARLVITSK
jgi:hypothetical protein